MIWCSPLNFYRGSIEGCRAWALAVANLVQGHSLPEAARSYWDSGAAAHHSLVTANWASASAPAPATSVAPEKIAAAVAGRAASRRSPVAARNKDPRRPGIYIDRMGHPAAGPRSGRGRALRRRLVAAPARLTSAIYSLCSRRHRAERARRTCRCRSVIERSEIHWAAPMDSALRSYHYAGTPPASQPCRLVADGRLLTLCSGDRPARLRYVEIGRRIAKPRRGHFHH